MRLRMTCTLWSLVRTGIVDSEEEVTYNLSYASSCTNAEIPSLPLRKPERGLWSIAISAIGERTATVQACKCPRQELSTKGLLLHASIHIYCGLLGLVTEFQAFLYLAKTSSGFPMVEGIY